MEIKLSNIGIIKDSTIKLDGLTVITGKNNSGKTTVGKTLYSIIDGATDINQKYQRDRQQYSYKILQNISNSMDFLFMFPKGLLIKKIKDYSCLMGIVSRRLFHSNSFINYEDYAISLHKELHKLLKSEILESLIKENKPVFYYEETSEDASVYFRRGVNEAISKLEKLFVDLKKDENLIDYTRESIDRTLQVEFSNQIQPIRKKVEISNIQLSNDNVIFFDIVIANNKIQKTEKPVFSGSPFEKIFFIDDPFVLDGNIPKMNSYYVEENYESIINEQAILYHNEKIRKFLKQTDTKNIIEQAVITESFQIIKEKIDAVLPGKFIFAENGDYYVQKGKKLRVENLATGSKMFSILKILIEKGALDGKTMLILDEPEAHLHPDWQNAFAEIIAILVKELHITVLLTTHSSNFMLALDAYMRKYRLENVSNFYQTKSLKDGLVNYNLVNDNMDVIYQDFLKYFSEMKVLREKFSIVQNEDTRGNL